MPLEDVPLEDEPLEGEPLEEKLLEEKPLEEVLQLRDGSAEELCLVHGELLQEVVGQVRGGPGAPDEVEGILQGAATLPHDHRHGHGGGAAQALGRESF